MVLAHLLVHETTHVLQGINRHSDYGVMKGQWDERDFAKMRWEPLLVDDDNIDLIY